MRAHVAWWLVRLVGGGHLEDVALPLHVGRRERAREERERERPLLAGVRPLPGASISWSWYFEHLVWAVFGQFSERFRVVFESFFPFE